MLLEAAMRQKGGSAQQTGCSDDFYALVIEFIVTSAELVTHCDVDMLSCLLLRRVYFHCDVIYFQPVCSVVGDGDVDKSSKNSQCRTI